MNKDKAICPECKTQMVYKSTQQGHGESSEIWWCPNCGVMGNTRADDYFEFVYIPKLVQKTTHE